MLQAETVGARVQQTIDSGVLKTEVGQLLTTGRFIMPTGLEFATLREWETMLATDPLVLGAISPELTGVGNVVLGLISAYWGLTRKTLLIPLVIGNFRIPTAKLVQRWKEMNRDAKAGQHDIFGSNGRVPLALRG